MKRKDLKEQRKAISDQVRDARDELKSYITLARNTNPEKGLDDVLDLLELQNLKLESLVKQRDEIDEELKKRSRLSSLNTSNKKKVRKVHNVSGRSIDPMGFNGLVSGGLPGSGKRK